MKAKKTVRVCAAMLVAVLVQAWTPAPVNAGPEVVVCEDDGAGGRPERSKMKVTGGINDKLTWMTADQEQFRIRKFSSKSGGSTLELSYRNDLVVIKVENGVIQVARKGKAVTVDTPESLEALQGLLAGSMAMFHTRSLLSELEGRSTLKGPEMSLLSAAAFAASLTGDTGAPLRLTDRFMERHRGIFRQVAFDDEESCWSGYEKEVNGSWNDLESCMDEANSSGWFFAGVRRVACNGIWLMRSESAWFEYIKCLSPLSAFPKLE